MIGKAKWMFVFVLLLAVSPIAAAAFPQPAGYVNDFANVLSGSSEAEITAIAEALAENQGIELAVVTLSDIGGQDLENYAVDLFAEWGIGGPEDSGILILLVVDTREIRVETGYGIETVLSAGRVGRILDQYVIPHLRNNDYDTGLVEAAKAYQEALTGASFTLERKEEEDFGDPTAFLIFLAVAIMVSIMARRRPPTSNKGSGNTPPPPRPVISPTRLPRSSGGRSGGGRSGGGFGGFGGGRSGGGGASRKF